VLHLIGYSHIDAAWLWPWRDGSNLALTTMRSALDRMRETPGFRYCHSSSAHYKWVQAADPGMFEEVKQRIAEGRWEVVGGWPVEPDCNIPSTESFVRHALYGKRYCEQQLGVQVDIGFNPDSFGHAAGLPTILRHTGYNAYVFMRPRESEGNYPRLFWWQGPDGSRVLTWHIYDAYDPSPKKIRAGIEHYFPPGFLHGASMIGVGDHGGAVTKAQIAEIEWMRSEPGMPELRWSTVREYLNAVASEPAFASLPVVRSELQHHARGCYSANGQVKIDNRRAERLLLSAESITLLASMRVTVDDTRATIADAWWRVLFNQFHDTLAGSAIYADYEQARDAQGLACQLALEHKVTFLEQMARAVDLRDVPEGAVFAYNPLPWARKAYLKYSPEGFNKKDPISHLRTPDGRAIPVQAFFSDSLPRIGAWVELPASGYCVFEAARGAVPSATPSTFPSHVTIASTNAGISSFKAEDGTELLAKPLGLVVIEDKSDTWAHGVDQFRKELGRPAFVAAEIVADGPVARVTRQHLRWQDSLITLDIAEYAGQETIELSFVIDWREHRQILMLEVPAALSAPRIFAKVPGAVAERKTNGDEEPYQDWVALQGTAGGATHSVVLLNAQTYSYDCLDGLLRTTLIRSAPYAEDSSNWASNGVEAWQDQGRQERRFWLMRARGEALSLHLDRVAEELQTPAEYIIDSRHTGTLPREQSLLTVLPSNISVLALKQAEDGDAIVLRLQERAGLATEANVTFPLLSIDQSLSINPWQILTMRIDRKNPANSPQFVSAFEH
jgi:alpha-mannosidase